MNGTEIIYDFIIHLKEIEKKRNTYHLKQMDHNKRDAAGLRKFRKVLKRLSLESSGLAERDQCLVVPLFLGWPACPCI